MKPPTSTVLESLRKLVVPNEEADRRRRAYESRQQAGTGEALWEKSGVPKRHALNSGPARPPMDADHPWERTRASLLSMLGRGVTLCLTGTRGTGKTQLGVECVRFVTAVSCKPAVFTTAESLFSSLRGATTGETNQTEAQALAQWRRPALLVIDEIGKTKGSEFELRRLFDLLNWRYNDMTDTVLTCNLDAAELSETLGPSIVDRMREGGGVIDCRWDSFRK